MFTYDPTTDIGRMRRVIPDKVEAAATWTDEELASFLIDEGDWRRAAAGALEAMAADCAYSGGVVQVGDLRTDGASMARVLLQRAAVLRSQAEDADASSEDGAWDIAEMVTGPSSYRERMVNETLREVG